MAVVAAAKPHTVRIEAGIVIVADRRIGIDRILVARHCLAADCLQTGLMAHIVHWLDSARIVDFLHVESHLQIVESH